MSPDNSELDYLRGIERLAHALVEVAAEQEWLQHGPEGQESSDPLRRAVNALATELRHRHFDGDGCVSH